MKLIVNEVRRETETINSENEGDREKWRRGRGRLDQIQTDGV